MIYPGYGCGGGYGKGWGKDKGKDWGCGGFPMKGGFKGGMPAHKGYGGMPIMDDDGMGMWVYMGSQGGKGGKAPMVPMGGKAGRKGGQFHGVGVPSGKNRQPQRQPQKAQKRQRAERSAPAGPLDESTVAQIADFLSENGGAVTLGKLSTEFSGLKKAQVLEHFPIVEAADKSAGDDAVTLADVDPSQVEEILAAQPATKKAKASKDKDKDPNAPPPPELDQHIIEEITQVLSDSGGTLSLGRVTSLFPKLKKAQLEPHFDVSFGEKDSSVSLFGFEPAAAAPPARGGGKGFGGGNGAKGGGHRANESPQGAPKKAKKDRDSKGPPPPDLDMSVVEQIGAYVESEGGSVSLGRLTTVFSGVKKVQLEGHFVVTAPGPKSDALVSMA